MKDLYGTLHSDCKWRTKKGNCYQTGTSRAAQWEQYNTTWGASYLPIVSDWDQSRHLLETSSCTITCERSLGNISTGPMQTLLHWCVWGVGPMPAACSTCYMQPQSTKALSRSYWATGSTGVWYVMCIVPMVNTLTQSFVIESTPQPKQSTSVQQSQGKDTSRQLVPHDWI